jgi:signal transduction histidine kinase
LNNILKHSKASLVDLQFFGYEDELVITIEDNGVGFDPEVVKKGIGLFNIQSRVESMGEFL